MAKRLLKGERGGKKVPLRASNAPIVNKQHVRGVHVTTTGESEGGGAGGITGVSTGNSTEMGGEEKTTCTEEIEGAAMPPVMRPLVVVAHVGDSRAILVRLGAAYAAQGPPLGDLRLRSHASGLKAQQLKQEGSGLSGTGSSARSVLGSGEYQELAPYV